MHSVESLYCRMHEHHWKQPRFQSASITLSPSGNLSPHLLCAYTLSVIWTTLVIGLLQSTLIVFSHSGNLCTYLLLEFGHALVQMPEKPKLSIAILTDYWIGLLDWNRRKTWVSGLEIRCELDKEYCSHNSFYSKSDPGFIAPAPMSLTMGVSTIWRAPCWQGPCE